ncbi:MAG TPA: hypothetical protein VK928_00795 [Longimicrobiales bacterium]|nr:hypothetical protein [Longimicrobiales bacterium]
MATPDLPDRSVDRAVPDATLVPDYDKDAAQHTDQDVEPDVWPCEQNIHRSRLLSITLEYEVTIGAGKPTIHTAKLKGDIDVLVTDMALSRKVRKAINPKLRTKCEKPPMVKRSLAAGGDADGDLELEPPECCYYINGKWICW